MRTRSARGFSAPHLGPVHVVHRSARQAALPGLYRRGASPVASPCSPARGFLSVALPEMLSYDAAGECGRRTSICVGAARSCLWRRHTQRAPGRRGGLSRSPGLVAQGVSRSLSAARSCLDRTQSIGLDAPQDPLELSPVTDFHDRRCGGPSRLPRSSELGALGGLTAPATVTSYVRGISGHPWSELPIRRTSAGRLSVGSFASSPMGVSHSGPPRLTRIGWSWRSAMGRGGEQEGVGRVVAPLANRSADG